MWVAYMIGGADGQGSAIGQFQTLDEAQQCCVNKEMELRKTLPLRDQQQIARDFAHYKMEWSKLHDGLYESGTLPPLRIPQLNGEVCFSVREIR